MNNWTQRLAIFAVLGAILSSAMLVGCGSPAEEATAPVASNEMVNPANSAAGNSAANNSAGGNSAGG